MCPFLRGKSVATHVVDERRLRGEVLAALSVAKFCLNLLKQASQQTMHTRLLIRANAPKKLLSKAATQIECSFA